MGLDGLMNNLLLWMEEGSVMRVFDVLSVVIDSSRFE